MSILSDFEDRVGGALEGVFAGVFRSPVQPVEIARALGKAMDDGRTVGVGKVYAPMSYTVALSPEDTDNFGGFTATLSGELATFLADHAREKGYHLGEKPQVRFIEHDDLRLGRFRVSAELAFAEEGERGRGGDGQPAISRSSTSNRTRRPAPRTSSRPSRSAIPTTTSRCAVSAWSSAGCGNATSASQTRTPPGGTPHSSAMATSG